MTDDTYTDNAEKADDAEISAGVIGDAPETPDAGAESTGSATAFTLYPPDVADDALTTTWLSAREGSYVRLADYR